MKLAAGCGECVGLGARQGSLGVPRFIRDVIRGRDVAQPYAELAPLLLRPLDELGLAA